LSLPPWLSAGRSNEINIDESQPRKKNIDESIVNGVPCLEEVVVTDTTQQFLPRSYPLGKLNEVF
jgi:hypothetical protein